MTPNSRAILEGIAKELPRLERQAAAIGDDFLAFLIASAAGEARDQLRDESLAEEKRASAAVVIGLLPAAEGH